jgi:nucleoside-diphosphate-sugar epimerase
MRQAMYGKPASILVTGGTGFFGRSLVSKLVAAGFSVRILSRRIENREHPKISICRGDLTNLRDLRAAVDDCDVIFHCAAEKIDEGSMMAVNVTATKTLFELAKDMRIRYFCHLSSVGVIGRTRLSIVDESAACNPMNQYETTKLAAEGIVGNGLDDGRVVILRPTNIFGMETMDTMLQKSLRLRIRNFAKGNECSHFVYVNDVVAAAMYWMEAPSESPVDTFIVSSDEETGNTNYDVQALLASRISTAPAASRVSAPLFVPYCARLLRHGRSNYGDVIYSSRKIHRAGFRFPFGLKAGLNDAIDGLLESRAVCGAGRARA